MSILLNEIQTTAKEHGIVLTAMPDSEATEYLQALKRRYGLGSLDGQLWTQIDFPNNKLDVEGWRLLPMLFADAPFLFFCDPYKRIPIYKFHTVDSLLKLLENTFHFVFYLASADLKKFAVFDDHECMRWDFENKNCNAHSCNTQISQSQTR